jgi:DNA polymerase-3 subunit gamma/tau
MASDTRGPAGGETDDTKLGSEPDPAQPTPGAKFTVTDIRRLWPEVLEEVKGKRRFTWILLSQNAQVAELRGDTLLLAMTNAGARDSFGRGGSEDVLREALVVVLGADFKIDTMVEPGNTSAASPRTPPSAPAPPPPQPVASPEPVDTRARDQARQSIRPTREDGRPADPGSDERDEAVSRDDDVLDDATESHRDLLTRHLGAEIISEEEPDT